MRAMRTIAFMSLLGIAPLACDSLAGSDYVGQPLITLTGSFASSASAPADPLGGVALLWQDPNGPGGPGAAATMLPVAIEFPAQFRVAVPAPPPTAARFQLDGIELAEAYVYLVTDAGAARPQPRGVDRGHALVWASDEVPAGSLSADYLGGAVTAGYHVRAFAAITTPGAAQQQMIGRCTSAGATASACAARRGYQLGSASDVEPLVIEVTP